MTRPPPSVAVIVPTLATRARAPYLERAIDSILAQRHLRPLPIVVVNGPDVDAELLAWLRHRHDIQIIEREEADLSAALAAGCGEVDTPFFAELDDDDLLLPSALFKRWQMMHGDERLDAVVTDGIVRTPKGDTHCFSNAAALRSDPLRLLLEKNWLLPGAVLFRTGRVVPDLFSELPRFLERTYLAAALVMRYRIAFLTEPTVIHYEGHAFSVNDSPACRAGRPAAIRTLRSLPWPQQLRGRVDAKERAAEHDAADLYLADRAYVQAWRAHLRSLAGRDGLRYLPFTWHVLMLGLHRRRAAATTFISSRN